MDPSRVESWMRDMPPTSGTSHSFEDIPLTPQHAADPPAKRSEGFFHVPLEHEMIAARSAWDDDAAPDEVGDCRSTVLSSSGEDSWTARAEKCGSTVTALGPRSDHEWISGVSTPVTASAATLVAILMASATDSGAAKASTRLPSSTESARRQRSSSSLTTTDFDRLHRTPTPTAPIPKNPTDTLPPAKTLKHTPLPRPHPPALALPIPPPSPFRIPIPIFPFPAGTTLCTQRGCPIKHPHERGPYLHDGKLRRRRGSLFGSSNPPPEIWFLYEKTVRDENVARTGDKAFAPVELFVKYHFGETSGGDEEGGRGRG